MGAGYFGQFGKVTRTRVCRSKRTGRSKGYAFLQFQHSEVAGIAADTMNGYMMFGHTLQCHTVPPERVHADLFKHAKMRVKPWRKIAAERHNRERTEEEERTRDAALIAKDQRRRERIKAAGINYEYEPLQPRAVRMKKTFD